MKTISIDVSGFIRAKCDGVVVTIAPPDQHGSTAGWSRLTGDYYMNVSRNDVTLVDITSLKEVIRWPTANILRLTSSTRGSSPRGRLTLELLDE